jgi:hypothetical protein
MSATASSPSLASGRTHRFRLRLPTALIWLLLLPVTLLLVPVLLLGCAVGGVNPFRAMAAFFRMFASLRGTHVEVQNRQVSILLSLF